MVDHTKTIDQLKGALKNSKQENRLLQEHHAQEQEDFKRRRCERLDIDFYSTPSAMT